MTTRIYAVTENATDKTRLISATSGGTALRHVTTDAYSVLIAKPKEIARLMAEGVKVEEAGEGAGES